MAKEVDLKKVELKVSINCCDGCKRKVKKLLQGIEGVLKTEIDPSLPKVTVLLSNVDPKFLLKKLLKIGKQAEIWTNAGNQKLEKDKKEMEAKVGFVSNGKQNVVHGDDGVTKSSCDNGKSLKSDQKKESGDDKGSKKKVIDQKEKNDSELEITKNMASSNPRKKNDNPDEVDYNYKNIQPGIVHAPTISLSPYSTTAVASYAITPIYVVQENSQQVPLPWQYQPPVIGVGDYFSVENTVGCHVM